MSTPLILAYAGMALMLTLSCIGSAIGVTMAGNTTVAGLKKKPDMFGKAMLLGVLPSTQGFRRSVVRHQAGQPRQQRYQRDVQRTRRLLPHHDSRRVPRALRHPGICLRVPRSAVGAFLLRTTQRKKSGYLHGCPDFFFSALFTTSFPSVILIGRCREKWHFSTTFSISL